MTPQHLRYSPVNWLVVPWGFKGDAFNECGLPKQQCRSPQEEGEPYCAPLPIQEAIDTYGWGRWLSEVIVGIDDPDDEIAASYVREAAIEFCRDSRILQREVVVVLQKGVDRYPLFPYEGERIVGAMRAWRDAAGRECCTPCDRRGGSVDGLNFYLDAARNELQVQGSCKTGELLRILVWATPTEDACAHDIFIYDAFRREIAQEARSRYARAVHFRDAALLRALQSPAQWEVDILRAKRKAGSTPSHHRESAGGMWQ